MHLEDNLNTILAIFFNLESFLARMILSESSSRKILCRKKFGKHINVMCSKLQASQGKLIKKINNTLDFGAKLSMAKLMRGCHARICVGVV